MLDADDSADPGASGKFIDALLGGAEFAKGTRFADSAGSSHITWPRRLGNAGLITLVNLLYRTRYTDLWYGINAYWAHCLPEIATDCDGFEVEAPTSVRLAKFQPDVQEVGGVQHRRLYGNSKLHTLRDGSHVLRTIPNERVLWSTTPLSQSPHGHTVTWMSLAPCRHPRDLTKARGRRA